MLNKENKDLCWKVFLIHGPQNQLLMLVEECAELQQAVSKLFRYKENRERLGIFRELFIEELIDVIVMCQQMLLYWGVEMDEVNNRAKQKLERAIEREGDSWITKKRKFGD